MTLDGLIEAAGRGHVIPAREDPLLLEQLRDPAVITYAATLLQSPTREQRRRAIFCLERIGYVLKDQESAELLLRHAETTADKNEAMTTLNALTHCAPPQPLPSARLAGLARRPDWQVRQAAIRCLHLVPATEIESLLLKNLDTHREDRVLVAFQLRFLSSPRSLAALEGLLVDQELDVRCVALDSVCTRLGSDGLPYARRLAEAGSHQEQWWAENWIGRFDDPIDVPFMAKRLKDLASRGRRLPNAPPEVAYLVPFLLRHAEVAAARSALAFLRDRVQRLPGDERQWLETHAPVVLQGTG